jgi:GTP-binding protein
MEARFILSSIDVGQCPKPSKPEYAFLGRSNVGKSSLINMLTGWHSLAKISVTPGKTRLINHFLIDDLWYLVDLPGYGFARISKEKRLSWDKMIHNYLISRKNLMCSFVLVDSRIEMQGNDLELIRFFGENQLPFVIVFTKSDKLTKVRLEGNVSHYKNELLKEWTELPEIFISSARIGSGKNEILDFIEKTNRLFHKVV